jgi:hypothetical protein
MRSRAMLIVVLALAVLGCEGRPPTTRAVAIAAADSLLLRDDRGDWGDAAEVLPPDAPDREGRRWWQVRYAAGADGRERVILVDYITGWARYPWPGYRTRVDTISQTAHPEAVRAQEGSFVLLVEENRDPEHRAELGVDCSELNHLARRTGLVPLFSLHESRDGTLRVIYGWQGDHGIMRDERVRDWLTVRTRFQDPRWLELETTR